MQRSLPVGRNRVLLAVLLLPACPVNSVGVCLSGFTFLVLGYQDMINFDTNSNIKCNFKVLVYFYNDNEDYNLIIPNELDNLKNFRFDKYIRNQTVCTVYGDHIDFKQLLEKHKLL